MRFSLVLCALVSAVAAIPLETSASPRSVAARDDVWDAVFDQVGETEQGAYELLPGAWQRRVKTTITQSHFTPATSMTYKRLLDRFASRTTDSLQNANWKAGHGGYYWGVVPPEVTPKNEVELCEALISICWEARKELPKKE